MEIPAPTYFSPRDEVVTPQKCSKTSEGEVLQNKPPAFTKTGERIMEVSLQVPGQQNDQMCSWDDIALDIKESLGVYLKKI